MRPVTLLKYHGLGNDFLVALEAGLLEAGGEVDPALAARLLDRHRGVGADGLIVRWPVSGGGVRMELRNADGGRAETSGNGLRCFALCLVHEGVMPAGGFEIETDAGRVDAEVHPGPVGGGAVTVSMGRASVGGPARPAPALGVGFTAYEVETGNPHLVLIGESLASVRIGEIGPDLERARPGGQNVEVVAPNGSGGLDLVVWERGVGLTQACGSGSCAAAAAARSAGLVGDRVVVRNPGGEVVVALTGEPTGPELALTGPAQRVGRIEVDLDELEAGAVA